MDTPICDFVRSYAEQDPLRLHMPGHKGKALLGPETLDITEVEGADVLYHARGIIRKSEENAAALFGTAATFYSAEGSSLCIRAMLYLAMLHARAQGVSPRIAAGRNAHKTFLTAAALLDLPIRWLWPSRRPDLLSCPLELRDIEAAFAAPEPPTAVYVTSPDYLGNRLDLRALADVCHAHGALLLVDNAHGAYLHFLPSPQHPMDLGADLCCDSAHKTLPVLTGGAYLHISRSAPAELAGQGENALSLFASTSPSYLILQSLDAANPLLAQSFPRELAAFAALVEPWKACLARRGWTLVGDEPLKLTLAPKHRGLRGDALGQLLQEQGISPEFADPDFLVLMLTPSIGAQGLEQIEAALAAIPPAPPIAQAAPPLPRPEAVLTPRQALFTPQEELPAAQCLGRVLAAANVSCPPAIPIAACGERLDRDALACLEYYGIDTCWVVRREFC